MKKILFGIPGLAMVLCLFTTACQNPPAPTETTKLDITCIDCMIDGKSEIHHIYTLNYNVALTVKADADYFLPDDVDAKIGTKQLVKDTDYTYSKDSGELQFAIKGDTTITITAQTKKPKLDVTCIDCTIDGQKEIHNQYTLNHKVALTVTADPNYILPDDVDAKIGTKQLVKDTDYTYSKDSGELKFTIKGDTTITITAQTGPKPKEELNDYTWPEIKEISDNGTASELFELGETKDIIVNNQTHKVRIIGFNQDYTDPDDKEGSKIGITFEFVDILSDENGYSLAAYWNDVDSDYYANYDYTTSTIRAVLNGEGTAEKNWFQYFGTEHDDDTNKEFSDNYSGKSVLEDMLPNDLKEVLTAPSKLVYTKISNSSTQAETNANWSETTIKDKLFLLSPREIGEEDEQLKDPSTFTYDFYKSDDIPNIRKKQQINLSDARETSLNRADLEGKFVCTEYGDYPFKISMAGVNEDDAGYYWLRSPSREGGYGDNCAWAVNNFGLVGPRSSGFTGSEVFLCASGLAPAFCI